MHPTKEPIAPLKVGETVNQVIGDSINGSVSPIEKAQAGVSALNSKIKPLFDMDFFSAAAGLGKAGR